MTETEKTQDFEVVEVRDALLPATYVVVRKGKKDLGFCGTKKGYASIGTVEKHTLALYQTTGGAWVAELAHTFSDGVVFDGWHAETLDLLCEELTKESRKVMLVFKLAMADAGQSYVQEIE